MATNKEMYYHVNSFIISLKYMLSEISEEDLESYKKHIEEKKPIGFVIDPGSKKHLLDIDPDGVIKRRIDLIGELKKRMDDT